MLPILGTYVPSQVCVICSDAAMAACEAFGMRLTQKGIYNDGSGMYAYYDARESLRCFVELLHSFPKG